MTTRKRKVEGAAESFADMVARYKAEHPDEWDALRLCPAQHALAEMEKALG